VPYSLLGFGGLSGIGGGILTALAFIGDLLFRGVRTLADLLLRFASFIASHPEAGVTMGAILWVLLAP